PGTDRALGLAALVLGGRPADAVSRFEAACRSDPADTVALHGLLAAYLQAGRYADAWRAATGRQDRLTVRAREILDLCRTLAWLDEPGEPGEQGGWGESRVWGDPGVRLGDRSADGGPWEGRHAGGRQTSGHQAQDQQPRGQWLPGGQLPDRQVRGQQQPPGAALLAEIAEGPDTAPWVAYALGRHHLLQGRARQAHDALSAVARKLPDRTDLAYHAAWARLLDGRHREVTERVTADAPWPLLCLLLDADPDHVLPPGARERILTAAGPLAPVVRARLLMADGRRPAADLPGWERLDLRGTALPHRLEALRTMLAAELSRGRAAEAERLTGLPLFRKLPRAEQRLWEGATDRSGDPRRAVRLLVEAHALGRDRAAQIRAAMELRAGNPDAVHPLLDGARGRVAELLRARAEIALGDLEAARRRLAGGRVAHLPRARYESGLIGLRTAALRWAAGDPDAAQREAEQAAALLIDAALAGPDVVPPV
ncbi:hypothetical protein OFY01_16865, partial [Streptomyces sp. GXMU-J5]|nr:hypothetical protein [Streptomyces beihaiensis]